MTISQAPELITPQLASQWLNNNAGNRRISVAHVRFLADQILTGQWQVTPDTIKISKSGRVLDGQHRLSAIVEANVAQSMYVARNCEDEIFTVLDTGKSRSASDVIAISGVKNPTHIASIARLIILHEGGGLSTGLNSKKRSATNGEVLATSQRIDLPPLASFGLSLYHKARFLNVSEYGFLYWLFAQKHTEEAEQFLSTLASGVGLTEGSSILMLRRKLEQARNGDRYRFSPVERLGLTIKAWNLYRLKKTVGMLVFSPLKEAFPEAI